jgi:hypothetical protein
MPTIIIVILSLGAACIYALAGPLARIFIRVRELLKPMPKITGFQMPEDTSTEKQVALMLRWGCAICIIGWWVFWWIVGGE